MASTRLVGVPPSDLDCTFTMISRWPVRERCCLSVSSRAYTLLSTTTHTQLTAETTYQ
jgi:hypothetical protein